MKSWKRNAGEVEKLEYTNSKICYQICYEHLNLVLKLTSGKIGSKFYY
eukprot:SAG31_NODE_25115_length_467_cov_5.097826_1_plen_47_part_10